MTTLRRLARGRPCLVRLPGCDGGGETTVLSHYRLAGLSGMGQKPPDVIGAWCCHSCHELCDSRKFISNLTKMEVRLALAEGCLRTIAALAKEGHLWNADEEGV
jgi:hypothetical protein